MPIYWEKRKKAVKICRVKKINNEQPHIQYTNNTVRINTASLKAAKPSNESTPQRQSMVATPSRTTNSRRQTLGNIDANTPNRIGFASYPFDVVIQPTSTQEDVFKEFTELVASSFSTHAHLFTYGQTGAGKTFTLQGKPIVNRNNFKIMDHFVCFFVL